MRSRFINLDPEHLMIFHLPFTTSDPLNLSIPSDLQSDDHRRATQKSSRGDTYEEPITLSRSPSPAPVPGIGTVPSDILPETEGPPTEQEICLSSDQQYVLDLVKSGRNVFFTGAAGTGKSILLKEIISWCRGPGHKTLAVTASTGIASVNIGGSTLHSWAGVGLAKECAEDLLGKIRGQDKHQRMQDETMHRTGSNRPSRVIQRWRDVDVLIIDESEFVPAFWQNVMLEACLGPQSP